MYFGYICSAIRKASSFFFVTANRFKCSASLSILVRCCTKTLHNALRTSSYSVCERTEWYSPPASKLIKKKSEKKKSKEHFFATYLTRLYRHRRVLYCHQRDRGDAFSTLATNWKGSASSPSMGEKIPAGGVGDVVVANAVGIVVGRVLFSDGAFHRYSRWT